MPVNTQHNPDNANPPDDNNVDNDGDLLRDFVHDLKTPIAAIKSYIELIEHNGAFNERQKHFADRAINAAMRMNEMINAWLDYARMDSDAVLAMTPCDLPGIVEDIVLMLEDLAAQRGITLKIEITPGLARVMGDANLLNHILSNLIGNAIQYNKDGGNVTIALSNAGGMVRIVVRDTGVGISATEQKKIFKRFYRANPDHSEGTGLGLAIVKQLVARHGGRIDVESEVNVGTAFTVLLPRAIMRRDGEDKMPTIEPRYGDPDPLPHLLDPTREHDDNLDDNLQEAPEDFDSDTQGDEF